MTFPRGRKILTATARYLTVLAVVLSSVAIQPAAHAGAYGCTQLGNWKSDQVCLEVRGGGLHIERARVDFSTHASPICNTKLYLTFFDLNNKKYDQRVSDLKGECTGHRMFEQRYNKNMRAGRICGAVSINGVLKPGACHSIFK